MPLYDLVAFEYRHYFRIGRRHNVPRDIRFLLHIQKEVRKRRLQNLHYLRGNV